MKNFLEYYYSIYPDKIYEKHNYYFFFIEDIKYYFVPFDRSTDELKKLVELTNKLYLRNIKVHTFIKNKDNEFYVKNNNDNYVLLRVNIDELEEIDIYDILRFNVVDIVNNLNAISPSKRWEKTVDSFEKEITELNKDYPELLKVFDYYVGLAENAISYIESINIKEDTRLFLSHKRIKTPLNYGMLYNPLSFIYDYKTRDLAEYIKESFFFSNFDEEEIMNVIDQNLEHYTLDDIKLLYGRLLYPTYYFDLFEDILNKRKEETELKKIVSLSEQYERFLKELYYNLKLKYNLEPIEWIVNN